METVHDIRARKRTEIGLSPNRPTANVVLQRPPENQTPTPLRWILVGLLLAMICATTLLVVARFFNSPTSWSWIQETFAVRLWQDTSGDEALSDETVSDSAIPATGRQSIDEVGNESPAAIQSAEEVGREQSGTVQTDIAQTGVVQTGEQYQLVWEDNFNPPHLNLALGEEEQSPYKWFNEQEGVYRMSVEANQATLSTLGLGVLGPHRVEVDMKILPDIGAGGGYAGLFGRYQNNDNFFLFLTDSQGQFQVQSRQNGEWTTHQSWMPSPALKPEALNMLAIEDAGQMVRLYGNNQLLFELPAQELAPGDIGLVGGMPAQSREQPGRVQIDFNAIRFFEPN